MTFFRKTGRYLPVHNFIRFHSKSLSGAEFHSIFERGDRHLPRALPLACLHRLPPRAPPPHRPHLLPLPHGLRQKAQVQSGGGEADQATRVLLLSTNHGDHRTLSHLIRS